MKRALEVAQFGLAYAVLQLERKGTPKALKVARALKAADAAINEYISAKDDGK